MKPFKVDYVGNSGQTSDIVHIGGVVEESGAYPARVAHVSIEYINIYISPNTSSS